MTREEAIKILSERHSSALFSERTALETLIPELKESEDEKIRKAILEFFKLQDDNTTYFFIPKKSILAWLEKQKEQKSLNISAASEWLRKHVCIYMNSEYNEFHKCVEYDGSIDKERLINDFEEAMRKEQKPIKVEVYEVGKGTTVCGQDYKCKKDYKEGNCWYIKDVLYHCSRDGYLTDQNGVSWSCTPEWFNEYIYTNNELADEEKNNFVRGQFLQCKRSFDEFKEGEHYWLEYVGDDMYVGRSDNILNQKFHITPRQLYTLFSQQLEKNEKEQDKCPEYCVRSHCIGCSIYEKQKEDKYSIFPPGLGEVWWNPISSVQQKPIFRVGDTIMAKDGTGIPQEMFYIERIEDGFYWEKDNTILISNQDEFQLVEPADKVYNVYKYEYVKKFKALCDAYEIKLPNRTYDIYHLCDDLAKLFGNTNNKE